VKLIDVYPEKEQKSAIEANTAYENSMNGYELPVAMEVRRGRYLRSYEQPVALKREIRHRSGVFPCANHDYAFLKGHRLMVQVQSSWFPLIDRNPQKFVPSIYQAAATDTFQQLSAYSALQAWPRTWCCR